MKVPAKLRLGVDSKNDEPSSLSLGTLDDLFEFQTTLQLKIRGAPVRLRLVDHTTHRLAILFRQRLTQPRIVLSNLGHQLTNVNRQIEFNAIYPRLNKGT